MAGENTPAREHTSTRQLGGAVCAPTSITPCILSKFPTMAAQYLFFNFVVSGKVQGVGFRVDTRGIADQLGVVGWVANEVIPSQLRRVRYCVLITVTPCRESELSGCTGCRGRADQVVRRGPQHVLGPHHADWGHVIYSQQALHVGPQCARVEWRRSPSSTSRRWMRSSIATLRCGGSRRASMPRRVWSLILP